MEHPNLEGLSLHEEEEGFRFEFEEDEGEQVDLRWCLVGRFISERAIHFNSMKVRMADLWKPVKGVTIKETAAGKFLFHFNHPIDMEAVLNGGPWTFDNNMLILEQAQLGMQIEHIPLYYVNMWVQVHDLPMGLMKEKVGIPLANYIGSFVEYDKKNNSTFWREYMRIRVKIDVRLPLKKDTKVMNKEGKWCTVKFKYEKLGTFCFVCGIMGHAENKCEVRFSMEQDDGTREWSAEIRAEARTRGGIPVSRWLREERGGPVKQDGGDMTGHSSSPASNNNVDPLDAELAPGTQQIQQNRHIPNQPAIITRQQQSTPINNIQAHLSNPSTNNHNAPALQNITDPKINDAAVLSLSKTAPPASQIDNLSKLFSTINSPMTSHQFNPIIINRPETETNKTQSLPHQSLTFTGQPISNGPHIVKPLTKKATRAPATKSLIRPDPTPKPDPISHRPSPGKKPKIIPNPTQHPSEPKFTQESVDDTDTQSEKKRRRE
uniref:CCHC-type domain-containing protein n=1 Tax=Trifolium medium TaxID=97028 RepID=A0A392MI71_9FABA